jgi:RHS repeat-associated protein
MYSYDGETAQAYYYQRNLQGDVIAILNGSGSKVAEYSYDAWGNCNIVSFANANLASYNPIRYRGYYYDRETGLYYLNARYYSPEWRRFISPDDTSYLDPENVNGLNLYVYCNNDPVGIINNLSLGISASARSSIGIGNVISKYHGAISNSSNILSALGALSTAFGYFDKWTGFLSGGLDAGLGYWGPKGFGIRFLGKYSSALSKFGAKMAIAGSALSWGSSVYNNFTNPNYTIGEKISASALDATYYAVKGYGTYWLGSQVGTLSVNVGIAVGSVAIGANVFGTTVGLLGSIAIGGGVAVLVGVAGAVAIYYLGEEIDLLYEKIKKEIFK